jgi:hypothetical protein
MHRLTRMLHCFGITLALLLACSQVAAGVISLTPPQTLNIDGQDIDEGVFTLKSFTGIALDLSQTEFLSLANTADDIMHPALIGSGLALEILSYPGSFPILSFSYGFDGTLPDLPEIISNVISASSLFTISLPFLSSMSDFFEVIDFAGNASFHSTAAVLDTVASGITNIDLFGDQTVFATFGASNVQLTPVNFQAHGTVVVDVPGPNSFWLAVVAVLLLSRKSTQTRR